MKVCFWGTRGSFAMCGAEFLRYGGNTSAVEVRSDSNHRLLIDLGTGATELAKQLMAGEFGQGKGTLPVLLSHTHLDHIQGLPFFTPFFIKGNQIRILGAEPTGTSLEDLLQNQLNPHYSPLYGLENLAAGVTVEPVVPGAPLAVEDFDVTSLAVPHGNMYSLAFRIGADGKVVVFIGDAEYPDGEPTDEVVALARGADLLIHDAMYTDEEYRTHRGWGHSSVSAAIEVAERAGVRELALFHHSPDATDEIIDSIVAQARAGSRVPVIAAAEGLIIDL